MNKDNAKYFLHLVQALADGKTIQYKGPNDSKWMSLTMCSFANDPKYYRVAPPVPKKMWAVRRVKDNILLSVYEDEQAAITCNKLRSDVVIEEYIQS